MLDDLTSKTTGTATRMDIVHDRMSNVLRKVCLYVYMCLTLYTVDIFVLNLFLTFFRFMCVCVNVRSITNHHQTDEC